jgi:restriction endonuclease
LQRNPREYELLVKELLSARLPTISGVRDLEIFADRVYVGKSGHPHHIDVALEFTLAGAKYLTIVECKAYSHTVGADDVLELATRLADIPAHKAILVSTIGFQRGAIALAKSFAITLVVACDLGWEPILESPLNVTRRRAEFMAMAVCAFRLQIGARTDEPPSATVAARLGELDCFSDSPRSRRPFGSLALSTAQTEYDASAFLLVGDHGELALNSSGLFEFVWLDFLSDGRGPRRAQNADPP